MAKSAERLWRCARHSLVASCLAALGFVGLDPGAQAEEVHFTDGVDVVACTHGEAFWAYGEDVLNPPAHLPGLSRLDAPLGSSTKAWSCQVGRHRITVRSSREVRNIDGPCGACDLGEARVWIDSVAVTPRELTGQARNDGDALLEYVLLLPDRLVICRGEGQAAEVTEKQDCETLHFMNWRGTPDPAFLPAEYRTPFRFDLIFNNDPGCSDATRQIVAPHLFTAPDDYHIGHDPSFDREALSIDWSVDQANQTSTGRFDIDNDGRVDDVRVSHDFGGGVDDFRTEKWSWRTADGQTHQIPLLDRSREGASGLQTGDDCCASFVYRPIHWRGRTLLYVRLLPLVSYTEADMLSVLVRNTHKAPLTRGLIELQANGAARLVCGWAPHPRPEDQW